MTVQDLHELEREYEAILGWVEFADLFERRLSEDIKISKAFELNFEEPRTPEQQRIKLAIDKYRLAQTSKLEQELFKQKRRLGDAERTLKTKSTKKALEDQRIADHNGKHHRDLSDEDFVRCHARSSPPHCAAHVQPRAMKNCGRNSACQSTLC